MANGAPPPNDPNMPGESPSAVNQQIVDAVTRSTGFVFGLENQLLPPQDGTRISTGAAIAYEKAAQAAAYAIQDSTDYTRNIMSISMTAQGKALAMMFIDKANIKDYAIIYILAMIEPIAAAITAGIVGLETTAVLEKFPRS